MYINKLLTVTALWCVTSSVYAANSFCFIPQGTVQERLRGGIESTRHGMDICIYDFAAIGINEDLESARTRGVRVRVVILEHGGNDVRGALAEALIQKGFDVRVTKQQFGADQMQDFMVFDDRVLVTGAYNWLSYRDRTICNDVIFTYDPDRIHAYKNTFYRLFTEGEAAPFPVNRKEREITNNSSASNTGTDDARQTKQEHPPNKERLVTEEAKKPAKEEIYKDFIDASIEELNKQFGKESTLSRSEKNELWKKYKGKYVRWNGVVSYKGMGRVDWNHIGVSRGNSKDAEVEILFDWRMFEKVMDVREGSVITYTGRLVSRPGINALYRLDNGDIEQMKR